jgi:hypothetical protein
MVLNEAHPAFSSDPAYSLVFALNSHGSRLATRRPLWLLAAVAIIAGTAVPAAPAGSNLLQNGGFEDGPRPDCPFVGLHWDPVEDGCQASVQQLSSTIRHSGNWAQKLGASPDTDFGWLRQVTNYNSVQAGKTYVISAWIKSTVTDGWGWNVFRLEVFNNDSALWHIPMPQQESPNYDWRLITWQEAVPAGFGINRVGATLSRHWQNGEVWYDDISISELTTGSPEISLAPSSISRVVFGTQPPPDDMFTVQNVGGSTLNYTVSSPVAWITPDPTGGSSNGEADPISLTYTTAGLTLGTYATTINVTDPNAVVPSELIDVSLTITAPGDFDLDFDVDIVDFGKLQECITGVGIPQNDPDCLITRMDGDVDVDDTDLTWFIGCLSGANVEADSACTDP